MDDKDRRPGIHLIAKRLKAANPKWTRLQIICHAKIQWQKEYDEKFTSHPRPQQLSDSDRGRSDQVGVRDGASDGSEVGQSIPSSSSGQVSEPET